MGENTEAPKLSSARDAQIRFLSSSVAAILAETLTLPTDVAKTRLQVQTNAKYTGFVNCLQVTAKEEGVQALWKGLAPALIRQVCYSSLSMVLYEPVRKVLTTEGQEPNFFQRLMAGGISGGLAITVFNPTEVIKTQMMSSTSGPPKTMASIIRHVYANGGIRAFWAGLQPNVIRTFLVNAAELGTYDQAKNMIIPYTGDNFASHLGASTIAGVASACTSTPADVVKTRLMNEAGGQGTGTAPKYSGFVDCFLKTAKDEGVGALYKGFFPIVVRKVLWCSAFFVSYEKIREVASVSAGH